jgi:hypothetical protein
MQNRGEQEKLIAEKSDNNVGRKDRKSQLSLLILLNHTLTKTQEQDARVSLQINQIIKPPEELREMWRQVPPEMPSIDGYLEPIKTWLSEYGEKGDFVLVQGDFGATYIMVNHVFNIGLVPVYTTTFREAKERNREGGMVEMTHKFLHQRFRRYGV